MKLIYPACFYPSEEGGYTIVFPDLPGCVTEGDTLSEAMDMAIDAASGWLLGEVEENKQLPKATDTKNIIPNEYENGFVSLIGVDLDEYPKSTEIRQLKRQLKRPLQSLPG